MKIKIKSREECLKIGMEKIKSEQDDDNVELVSGDPLMYLPQDIFGKEAEVLQVYQQGSHTIYETRDPSFSFDWDIPDIFVEEVLT